MLFRADALAEKVSGTPDFVERVRKTSGPFRPLPGSGRGGTVGCTPYSGAEPLAARFLLGDGSGWEVGPEMTAAVYPSSATLRFMRSSPLRMSGVSPKHDANSPQLIAVQASASSAVGSKRGSNAGLECMGAFRL